MPASGLPIALAFSLREDDLVAMTRVGKSVGARLIGEVVLRGLVAASLVFGLIVWWIRDLQAAIAPIGCFAVPGDFDRLWALAHKKAVSN